MQVESWIMEHGTEWVGESWDELKYIRQVRLDQLATGLTVQYFRPLVAPRKEPDKKQLMPGL